MRTLQGTNNLVEIVFLRGFALHCFHQVYQVVEILQAVRRLLFLPRVFTMTSS